VDHPRWILLGIFEQFCIGVRGIWQLKEHVLENLLEMLYQGIESFVVPNIIQC